MIPGEDQIIVCPNCKGLAWHMTLVSGNTVGERVWTDGKQIAPMLPKPPAVVKCRHCGECYWRGDAEEIGTIDRWQKEGQHVNSDMADAQEVVEPLEEEYYQALEKRLASNEVQERYLRVLAWWRRNDPYRDIARDQSQEIASSTGPWRKNLEALLNLLTKKNDNDYLMKSEVLRELGQFESAKEALSRVDSPEVSAVVHQFRSLCDTGDTCVRELHFSA